MSINFKIASLLVVFTSLNICFPAAAQERVHALALHGKPKYEENFSHFDYTNPDAPKGGILRLGVVSGSGFDSLNPFVIKGNPADGVDYLGNSLLYDSLTVASEDEPFTQYGLIAESMELAEDRSWIIYHINPIARFHDGEPVTADDVEFTFELLTEKGHPLYSTYYQDVLSTEVLDPLTIRFNFQKNQNRELPLIVGQLPVLPKHFWQDREFKASLDIPLGSGPYKIKSVDAGRSITYERDNDYWARDLAVNKGSNNFDEIQYEYYLDSSVALEAFKAGEFDLRQENSAKNWATAYTGPQFDRGDIVTEEIHHEIPAGMQAFVMNIRRDPFKDIRVRKALSYAFDFEWTRKNIFNGAYQRSASYFSNSDLASSGVPSGLELEILEPYRDQLPEQLFTEAFTLPVTEGDGNNRTQLRQAAALLQEAGWEVKNGQLTHNETGEVMTFEILAAQASDFDRVVLPFAKNLERLGIVVEYRAVDTQQYIARINEFDYDMLAVNYIGIKSPMIDQLIEEVIAATDREQLVARVHALDRVLLWNYFVIPQWYNDYFRVAYWNKFARPEIMPKTTLGLMHWWYK